MRVLNEGDDYDMECCCLIKDLRVEVRFRLVFTFISSVKGNKTLRFLLI